MGKPRGGRRPRPPKEKPLDSDEEFADEPDPDPKSRSYVYDEIDEFHNNREKVILDAGRQREVVDISDDDEVYSVGGSSDSDEDNAKLPKQNALDMDSDEEEDNYSDTPVEEGWGKKKASFYNTGFVDKDYGAYGESDDEKARFEEQTARDLQQKMLEQIDEFDFGLDQFQTQKKDVESKHGTKVEKDFSKMSKREKLELLKRESPELINLLEDFKIKLSEMQNRIQPLFELASKGEIPAGPSADYVNVKYQLILNYCINVCFYMMLKAKRVPLTNHPIIRRLVSYRQLMKELEPLDEKLAKDIDALLECIDSGKRVGDLINNSGSKVEKRAKLKVLLKSDAMVKQKSQEASVADGKPKGILKRKKDHRLETEDEKNALMMYGMMKAGHKRKKDSETDEDDVSDVDSDEHSDNNNSNDLSVDQPAEEGEETLGKRGITYEIAKNKGLTPYRKKEVRNPRVKNRMKYRKAKIRRKGQVRESRKELAKYGGEISGIKATSSRSVKLK